MNTGVALGAAAAFALALHYMQPLAFLRAEGVIHYLEAGAGIHSCFPIVDIFHATGVSVEYRRDGSHEHSWLQRVVAVVLTSLGGTMVTGWLLGQPVSWVAASEVVPAYVAMWCIVHYSPGDVVYRALTCHPIPRFALAFLDDISWGFAITAWGVEKGLNAQHPAAKTSMAAALFCGISSGCGGGLFQQAFGLLKAEWAFTTPASIKAPSTSSGLFVSCACACFYYAVRDQHACLWFLPAALRVESRESAMLCVIFMVMSASSLRKELLAIFRTKHVKTA